MKADPEKVIEKQRMIIEGVVSLMDESGLKNVMIKDICEKCGISVGAFYHYFKTKDSIVPEMYRVMDLSFQERRAQFEVNEDEGENLMELQRYFIDFIKMWGFHANRLIVQYSLETTGQKPISQAVFDILERIFSRGQEKRQFSKEYDSVTLAQLFYVTLRGHSYVWARQGQSYDIAAQMQIHAKLFVSGIRQST